MADLSLQMLQARLAIEAYDSGFFAVAVSGFQGAAEGFERAGEIATALKTVRLLEQAVAKWRAELERKAASRG